MPHGMACRMGYRSAAWGVTASQCPVGSHAAMHQSGNATASLVHKGEAAGCTSLQHGALLLHCSRLWRRALSATPKHMAPSSPMAFPLKNTARTCAGHIRAGALTPARYPARHSIPTGTASRTARHPARHGLAHGTASDTARYPARLGIPHGTVSRPARYPTRHAPSG